MARNLIYERELSRSKPEGLHERVKELLRKPLIDRTGKCFILEVENSLEAVIKYMPDFFGALVDGSMDRLRELEVSRSVEKVHQTLLSQILGHFVSGVSIKSCAG